MWVKGGTVGALLALGTACESGTVVDLVFTVPADVAEAYDPEIPGLLRSSQGDVTAVCGEAITPRFYQSLDFSCRPDDPDVTVEAWIVPAPKSWGPVCDLPVDDDGAMVFDSTIFLPEDVPERTDDDPYGAVDAHWKWTPICGGNLRAELVLAAP